VFGSQALETAIGLALLFFVVATAASAVVEVISRWLDKRARDLEAAIAAMLTGSAPSGPVDRAALRAFFETSVYTAARTAAGRTVSRRMSGRHGPSYLSARSFADAVAEMISRTGIGALDGFGPLRARVAALVDEAGADVLHVKAGLENWFDETMQRLQGAYKRWATAVLFAVGAVIAVVGNVSAVDVADRLWHDPVTRQVVIDAAGRAAAGGSPASAAAGVDGLSSIGLPLGWHGISGWGATGWASHLVGWLATALLVMLGAPFWFDTLSRLVSLRTAGPQPAGSDRDPASATAQRARGGTVSFGLPDTALARELASLIPAPPPAPPA
jgi:hypothetical protein